MEKNEYILRLRRALGNSSAEFSEEVMHAFEEYSAEELSSGKHPQDILDSFGSPEDLALSTFQPKAAKRSSTES